MNVICFGDSEMAGALISDAARLYHAWNTALLRGEGITNHALAGNRLADIADPIFAHAPSGAERYEIQVGTNDIGFYGAGAGQMECYRAGIAALSYWLTGDKTTAVQPGWTFTGSWTTTGTTPGKYTTAAGAMAQVSFSGDVLLLGYTITDNAAVSGRASVEVDGVLQSTVLETLATGQTDRKNGTSYQPALLRLDGFGSGSHTVKLTSLDAGKMVFIDWVGGASNGKRCSLLTSPIGTSAAYGPNWNATSIAAFNAVLADVAAQAVTDGRDVHVIDINSGYDPSTDAVASGDHPNNIGLAKWTNTKLAALAG